jgi:hypothetical protein
LASNQSWLENCEDQKTIEDRMMILPLADRFPDHFGDDPFWNESVWFSIAKPDEKINGIIHYYFRPNMNMLNGGPILWQPHNHSFWNCMFHDWAHLQPVPAGAEKFNMTARNSLSVKVLEPLTRYAIAYDNHGCTIDLLWEAIGPMHELRTEDPEQASKAKFHIEQPGRMTGTIALHDRVIPIDCLSMRDASSGPREYGNKVASGSYFWGIAQDSCFHAITMGEGPLHRMMGGFIWKDGVMSSLVSGTRQAVEFGRYGPSKVVVEATDKLGRSVTLHGRVEQGLIHTGYTSHTVVWSQAEWEWDGVTHWGEHQEFCGAERFRQIARGDITLG